MNYSPDKPHLILIHGEKEAEPARADEVVNHLQRILLEEPVEAGFPSGTPFVRFLEANPHLTLGAYFDTDEINMRRAELIEEIEEFCHEYANPIDKDIFTEDEKRELKRTKAELLVSVESSSFQSDEKERLIALINAYSPHVTLHPEPPAQERHGLHAENQKVVPLFRKRAGRSHLRLV